ncbi:hypothetical protein QFC19_002817 [Naganishia cerealis]|uniref:Uncharacterized protein n=1 Tax=Naganishia cerealis TaxID=610337 RepID=A0ACC2W7S9_9TREE|nr:hypothetical protein QFC19_002817 [Naganishia cerealis]
MAGETNHVPGSAPIHPALALAAAAAADIHSTDDNDHNASSHAGDGNAERGADGATYLPYPIITHPQPAASHGLYPNYTPFDDTVMALLAGNVDGGGGGAGESGRQRGNASFMRDTRQGRLVAPSPARKYLPMSVPVGAEWEEGYGWRTWVGPVLLFAQLSSSAAHPSSAATGEVDPTTAQIIDGPIPPFEFGPRGMYASFDWADLDALAPWLELPQVENGNDGPAAGDEAVPGVRRPVGTHRAGMGFGT